MAAVKGWRDGMVIPRCAAVPAGLRHELEMTADSWKSVWSDVSGVGG